MSAQDLITEQLTAFRGFNERWEASPDAVLAETRLYQRQVGVLWTRLHAYGGVSARVQASYLEAVAPTVAEEQAAGMLPEAERGAAMAGILRTRVQALIAALEEELAGP